MSMGHSLISRNVTIGGRRTSLRLEHEAWDALGEICRREGKSVHEVCSHVEEKRKVANRTSAVRSYIISYYREAATDDGHQEAGHGLPGGFYSGS